MKGKERVRSNRPGTTWCKPYREIHAFLWLIDANSCRVLLDALLSVNPPVFVFTFRVDGTLGLDASIRFAQSIKGVRVASLVDQASTEFYLSLCPPRGNPPPVLAPAWSTTG